MIDPIVQARSHGDRATHRHRGAIKSICVAVALVLLIVASLLMATASPVQASEDAYEQSALVMLRLLAYDRNLADRVSGRRVEVVIVYPEGGESGPMSEALRDVSSRFELEGRRVRVHTVEYRGRSDFEEQMDQIGPAAIFVADGMESNARRIARYAVDHDLLTFGQSEELMNNGIAVSLIPNGQVELVIHLNLARAQGADFPGSVLRIADDVRR